MVFQTVVCAKENCLRQECRIFTPGCCTLAGQMCYTSIVSGRFPLAEAGGADYNVLLWLAGSLAAAGTANGIVRGCFEMQNSENCDRRRSLSQTMKDGDSTVMVRSGSRTGGSVSPANRRSREKSTAIPFSDSWAGPSSPSSVWALWRAVWWQWALCTMWCRLRPVTATCWTSTTSN